MGHWVKYAAPTERTTPRIKPTSPPLTLKTKDSTSKEVLGNCLANHCHPLQGTVVLIGKNLP